MALEGRRRVEEQLAWKYSEAPLLESYCRALGLEAAPASPRAGLAGRVERTERTT